MPIRLTCNKCGIALRVPDEAAGRKAKCPTCGDLIDIPDDDEVPVEAVSEEPAAPTPKPPPPSSGPGMPCVLIIDDDPDLAATVRGMLQREDCRVESATNGSAGLEMARRYRPDIVLLDAELPDADSFELFERIKQPGNPAEAVSPRSAIVMLTPRTNGEAEARAKSIGADGHMRKPLYPAALCQLVIEIIEERRQ